jgi:hypothetical protein
MASNHHDIEAIVTHSLKHGNAVLLKLKGKPEAIPCGIANFRDRGDLKLIELNHETLYGKPLDETVILLTEIETLQLLVAIYDDPMYVKLRRIKKTILNSF